LNVLSAVFFLRMGGQACGQPGDEDELFHEFVMVDVCFLSDNPRPLHP
jgi:hypothetical protein